MIIIPVMDVMNGIVVHGVSGLRSQYKPLESRICSSNNPIDVADAIRRLGFSRLYIADLDAIMGGEASLDLYMKIKSRLGFKLLIDAGINSENKLRRLIDSSIDIAVIGTETLTNLDFVKYAVRNYDDRIALSIDTYNGIVKSMCSLINGKSVKSISELINDLNVKWIIYLDISRVGTLKGIDFKLIEDLIGRFNAPLIVGGGIRCIDDLVRLRDVGVYGVLVATIIHKLDVNNIIKAFEI
ncbi:MAG: HisA/HisF-related TIM barrel protein [Candidatus Methanomethylicia archaeon]